MRVCLLCLLIVAAGCHRAAPAGVRQAPRDPAEKLHEQVGRGAYQLLTAVGDLDIAVKDTKQVLAKAPAGQMHDDLQDVEAGIDSCGRTIADYTEAPPDMPEFKNQAGAQADHLKKALAAAGDALLEMYDAWGTVDGMLDAPPKDLEGALEDLSSQMETVIDELRGAIEAMGGTPPAGGPSDDSQDDDP